VADGAGDAQLIGRTAFVLLQPGLEYDFSQQVIAVEELDFGVDVLFGDLIAGNLS
jgi:hypothetical protein